MATINCPKCETTISGEGNFCPYCGASVYSHSQHGGEQVPDDTRYAPPGTADDGGKTKYAPHYVQEEPYQASPKQAYTPSYAQGAPVMPPRQTQQAPPKTWLLESVLATIFCCLPAGLVGIIYASNVESHWYKGNREAAVSSANTAKTWTIVSFVVGLVSVLTYVLLVAFGVLAGFWSEASHFNV